MIFNSDMKPNNKNPNSGHPVDKNRDYGYPDHGRGNYKRQDRKNQEILEKRAKALAKKPEKQNNYGQTLEVVEFMLDKERYGIEAEYIQEIHPLKEYTPLPFTPSFVMGIINIRGQILSIIDIKIFFDLPKKGIIDQKKVIIVHANEMNTGILVDSIISVETIPIKDIQPPILTLSKINADFLRGIATGPLIILNVQKIFSDKRMIIHDET